MKTISFDAEIKQISSKTLASLDKEYRTILASSDDNMYALGLLPPNTIVTVTVEVLEP